MTHKKIILHTGLRFLTACILIMLMLNVTAQENGVKQFKVKDNLMFIVLSRSLSMNDVDEFTTKYNIAGIGLHQLIKTGKYDSIQAMGWSLDQSNPAIFCSFKTQFIFYPIVETSC